MPARSLPEALIRAAAPPPATGTDADLPSLFVSTQNAEAFAELVRRHGPMVLGVCRRVLGNTPDADDAFQAVWLVLVRKARGIEPRGRVGNWLYGVAARTAAHLRAASRRRKQQELPDVADRNSPDPDGEEVVAVVDAELAKLPDKYRAAVVLCELEGRSLKDVAEELGVPVGTVASRLARGRALLAARLQARGFAAGVLTGLFAAATAPVSARLAELTVALLKVGAQKETVSELARGVLSAMLANKLKALGKWAVAVAAAAGAVVWVAAVGAQPAPTPPQSGPPTVQGNPYAGLLMPRGGGPTWDERAWDDLARDDPHALRAAFELANSPKTALHLFDMKKKLRPLKTDKEQVKKWIAALNSDNREEWEPAFADLSHFDPRLALDPEAAFAEAKGPLAKQRLAAILTDSADPNRFPKKLGVQSIEVRRTAANGRTGDFTYTLSIIEGGLGETLNTTQSFAVPSRVDLIRKPTWTRDVRAVVILEQIRTPEAMALLKEMATGHLDAIQTRTAKEAIARLTAPAP